MAKKEYEYKHHRHGDTIKVEIRDQTYRVIYRTKFDVGNKIALIQFLEAIEKFSGFSIAELVREKLKIGEWF
jgi:hypothetical protein